MAQTVYDKHPMKQPIARTRGAVSIASWLAILTLGCDSGSSLVGMADGGAPGEPFLPPAVSPSEPGGPTTSPVPPTTSPPLSPSPAFGACRITVAPVPVRQLRIDGAEAVRRVSTFLWGVASASDPSPAVPATNKDVGGLARTMMADPRTRATVVAFFRRWLDLDATLQSLERQPHSRPGELEAPLFRRMLSEMNRFAENIVFGPVPTLSALLAANHVFEDQDLGQTYGTRAGLLSQPGFLAAHPRATYRGIQLLDAFACREVPPPPPSVDQTVVREPGTLTFREGLEKVTSEPACASCHQLSDPPGFALESFDDLGKLRTHDNGRPINARGTWQGTAVDGAVALAAAIDGDCEAKLCLAASWLGFATGQASPDRRLWERFGPEHPAVREIAGAFLAAGNDLRALMVGLVESEVFLAP